MKKYKYKIGENIKYKYALPAITCELQGVILGDGKIVQRKFINGVIWYGLKNQSQMIREEEIIVNKKSK